MKTKPRNSCIAFLLAAAAMILPTIASAIAIPIGYFSWDVTNPTLSAQFDIVNQTGANSSGDDTWPVLTPVSMFNLAMTVHFTDGTARIFDDAYFSLAADGYSFDGSAIPIAFGEALPVDATLTGMFGTLNVSLFDGTSVNLLSPFTATIGNTGAGLQDGALQTINATTADATSVPEPGSASLLALGLAALFGFKLLDKRKRPGATKTLQACAISSVVVSGMFAVPVVADAATPVRLNSWTSPDHGTAGSTLVNLTTLGMVTPPAPPLSTTLVTISQTCGGTPIQTMPATSVRPVAGTSYRIQFPLPVELPSGVYFVSLAAKASSGFEDFASTNCSMVNVTGRAAPGWTTLIGRRVSVPAGSESYRCRTIQIPTDMYITAIRSPDSAIDFERTLTVSDTMIGSLGDFNCSPGQLGDKMLFAAGIGTDDLHLPPGVALHARAGQFIILNTHLWNPGASPVTDAQTVIEVQTTDASAVTTLAELTYAGTYSISIPNDASFHTAIGGCSAPVDYTILALWPHMHLAGRHMSVVITHTTPATVLNEDFDVSNQDVHFVTHPVHQGDQIQVTCAYNNPTSGPNPLTFGDNVEGENCFVGIYRTPVIARPTNPLDPGYFTTGTAFECITN